MRNRKSGRATVMHGNESIRAHGTNMRRSGAIIINATPMFGKGAPARGGTNDCLLARIHD